MVKPCARAPGLVTAPRPASRPEAAAGKCARTIGKSPLQHSQKKMYYCEQCPYTSDRRANVRRHLTKHLKETARLGSFERPVLRLFPPCARISHTQGIEWRR